MAEKWQNRILCLDAVSGSYFVFRQVKSLEVYSRPTDAQAAVPCWDEPQLKATWSITMISQVETVNISSMAAESEVAQEVSENFEKYTNLILGRV
jgi:hypothetical protein